MKRETQRALLLACLLIVLFGALKHAAKMMPAGGDIAFAMAFLFQVFVPVWIIEKQGFKLQDFKIGFPKEGLWQDLRRVFILSAIVFVLFFAGYYVLQSVLAGQNGMQAHFKPALPDSFLNFALATVVVALAEEVFYRGYIQTTLLKEWSVPIAFVVTNIFFALGHFIGDYHFGRLLPFFPGLLFSYLVFRSRSIVGAIIFHGLCNIYAELLRASYYWSA